MTPSAAVSTRVDSGVSGMQSSACTLTSSHEAPPPDLMYVQAAADWSSRAQSVVGGGSPVWNLSQMSMDVRSCPGGTSCVSLPPPPPLYLYQYVNGYSDAMLLHAADRLRPSMNSSQVGSTTATHCAAVDEESSRCGDDAALTVPLRRSGLTVQTRAIVEPSNHHDATRDSPCVCGQPHDLPPSADPPEPPPPTDAQTTSAACELAPPPRSSVVCGPPPSDCKRQIELLDCDGGVKATTASDEVERRRLLTRLLLGYHDELTLSAPVYVDETYF